MFQLEPTQIFLFNSLSASAETFMIRPLDLPVHTAVDTQEKVPKCNAGCVLMEQILFKRKKVILKQPMS